MPATVASAVGGRSRIVIRYACPADDRRSRGSKGSSGRSLGSEPILVAESDGDMVAASSTDGGDVVADPFRVTLDVSELLRLRTSQLRPPPDLSIDSAAVVVERIGVVGLGAMGAGIAQVAVEAGFDVVGREVTAELGEAAAGRIVHFLTRKVEKGQRTEEERDAAVARLATTTELDALADCDLVIEAIVEELDAKRELFAQLPSALPPRTRSSPRTRRRCR